MNSELAIIISYCSNEKHLIHATLSQSLNITPYVFVSVGTHFYDYTPENCAHIEDLAEKYPEVQFVWYPVTRDFVNPLRFRPEAYWHNIARIAGWSIAKNKNSVNWILFLDADEVPEATKFNEWWSKNHKKLDENISYRLTNYWYFRDPENQAKTDEDSVLLIHKKHCSYQTIMNDMERIGMAENIQSERYVMHPSKKPMFHHYSWVRSKAGILQKVRNWGHKSDKDWEGLIEKYWDINPIYDFVHGYSYKRVPNQFNIVVE